MRWRWYEPDEVPVVEFVETTTLKVIAVAIFTDFDRLNDHTKYTFKSSISFFMTIQQFKTESIKNLTQTSPSPALDVEVLLLHALGFTKTELLMKRDMELSEEKEEWLNEAVERRAAGLPVAYITGHKEFYGYDFLVTPAVLIPKPDTEILVSRAVELILEKIEANPDRLLTVCDMCTGSGCIALSVLKSLYESERVPQERLPKFTLVDISGPALEIARKNAEALLLGAGADGKENLLERVRFVQSNLFEQLPYQFDLVLTNPPYVPSSLTDELLKDGRSEPRLALDGDITITGDRAESDDGLEIIRNLMPQIYDHTVSGGFFLMETGEYNMRGAENLSYRAGFRNTQVFTDLEGQERVLYGEKKAGM